MADDDKKESPEPVENQKVISGMLVALLVIGLIVGGGYAYSRKKSGQTVFPAGYQPPIPASEIDCGKPSPAAADLWDYYTKCDRIKVDPAASLETVTNKQYNFSFSLHGNIELTPFGNGMGIGYKELAPQNNLLYTMDIASSRSGELASLTGEDYVRNYWRQYPGLTGVQSLEKITNGNNNTAYKAVYVIGNAKEGKLEVFFELKDGSGDFVHFTSGILDQPLFDTIVGSFKYPASE